MKEAIINSTNYEAWLLDFAEGRLSSSEVELLHAFAKSHPELNIDLQDLELFYFESDTEQAFDIKANLKKGDLSIESADEILFEAIEDETQLNKAEQLLLDYPNLVLDFEAYKKTKLQADLDIVFTNKIGLKKSLALDEASELKIFEATELGLSHTAELSALAENKSDLTKTIKAYQLARFAADESIVFPNKKALKKALFFGMQQKTLYRVAALLIGISFLGTYIFTSYQNPNDNGLIAKNDTLTTSPLKANSEIAILPKQNESNTIAAVEIPSAIKSEHKLAKTNKKIKAPSSKTLNVLPESKPMQAEINLANNTSIQMEDGITVQPISAEDPIILALENKNELKKVNPTLVIEDREEELVSVENATKDPLLYTAANKVNRVLGFITNKKIPVSKKKDKDKVSYAIGKDLLSYSTNKKMQP
jgi:hypothetical protein